MRREAARNAARAARLGLNNPSEPESTEQNEKTGSTAQDEANPDKK